jgi:hypothetical protein
MSVQVLPAGGSVMAELAGARAGAWSHHRQVQGLLGLLRGYHIKFILQPLGLLGKR